MTDRRVKRHFPILLKRHGLKVIWTNNSMKEDLGLDSAGYPRVIVPASYDGSGQRSEARHEWEPQTQDEPVDMVAAAAAGGGGGEFLG